MKKEIRVTKGQFERLIESVHKQKFSKPLREANYGPGAGAADGMVVVLDALQQAWKYITDPELKTKVKGILSKSKKQSEVSEANYGPGAGAADGMVVVLDALQQAWKYITDPELKTKVKGILSKNKQKNN